ncbi:MAG: hypothetical protein QXQ94_09670 [Candidatus Bathyarchaeia archaeon]
MLHTLLDVLSQEPPTPTTNDTTDILPSPIIFIAIAIIIAEVIAWKYKAYLQFAAITCATVGGFIIGLILTPPYANIGLGTMTSLAALFLSTAIIIIIKLARK